MPAFSSTDELTVFSTALAGQYEIDREIGRGGMGVVYLARDLRLDRMVAIKTLPLHLANDPLIRDRFLREARTAARLAHPNIVPVHRADEIGGQVFFVMGFIDGDSVAQKLVAGPLSPRDALPILRDVSMALGHAHKQGVIHRDVKTENILLDTLSGRAMVTDFGIAHVAAAQPLTATGQVLGTVYYLSPEQVSDEEVDARSDIYSLGVVGFAMLSGRFPFDGGSASAVLISHVIKPAPKLLSVAPHVPASLAAIIDRCLTKDPDGRFQSCAEFEAALERARPDAVAVTGVGARSPSPLLSDTEAQHVLRRAAELDDTGVRSALQVPPVVRDKNADAQRREGFKTSVLRDAAAEAGIAPQNVERALAERGLRPSASVPARGDRRAVNLAFDLTKQPDLVRGQPAELVYEMVVQGELDEEDYDVMISALNHHTNRDGLTGTAASLGRALTWNGRTSASREVRVSVTPREGRTTIRVEELLKHPIKSMYGLIMGAGGGGLGGMFFGSIASDGSSIPAGLAAWGMLGLLSFLAARTAHDEYSKKRQVKAKELLEALAAQTRELAKPIK